MQKMAQEWFSQTGSSVDDSQKPSSSSLLADWNSYAASQSTDESSSLGLGFDLESVVRSANDTVSGTFSVVQDIKKPKRKLFAGEPPNKSLNSSVSCQLDFTLRTGIACATCGAKSGYVFRGKGFPMCQKCFDASSR